MSIETCSYAPCGYVEVHRRAERKNCMLSLSAGVERSRSVDFATSVRGRDDCGGMFTFALSLLRGAKKGKRGIASRFRYAYEW